MTAQEMFRKLGYVMLVPDNTEIRYVNSSGLHILFGLDKKYVEKGDIYTHKFIKIYHDELKAINKQVEELGW